MLFLTAEKCNETTEIARQEMLLNYQKEEIRLKFGSEFLNESTLLAYEKVAKQKLTDFAFHRVWPPRIGTGSRG